MKKLHLLSALLIFACSSDDNDNNSNHTFLERFDGVVWESQENGTRRVFYNSPPSTGFDVLDEGEYMGW